MNSETLSNEPETANHLVLSTTRKMGWFRSLMCYMVFQDNELILVHLDTARIKEAQDKFRDEQKAQGKGIIKTTFAMMGFWRNYGHRFYNQTREELLAIYPGNIAIPYQNIQRLVFRTARSDNNHDNGNSSGRPGKIIILSGQDKFKFSHDYYDSNKKIKEILQRFVGPALKYRAPFFHRTLTINIGGSPDGIN